jgi:hypothetical protein
MRFPVDCDSGACAAPQDYREHNIVPRSRAIDGLGCRQTVGIIFDSDLSLQGNAQIFFNRLPEQPGGARSLTEARLRFKRPGYTDADCAGSPCLSFDPIDEVHDDPDAPVIVVTRRICPQSQNFFARQC